MERCGVIAITRCPLVLVFDVGLLILYVHTEAGLRVSADYYSRWQPTLH